MNVRNQRTLLIDLLGRLLDWTKARSVALATGVLSFAAMLPVARLDPDIHHDGIMSTAASAFASLRRPHTDFFAQYGPANPVLQSLPVFAGLPSILGLRLMNAFFISLTIFLIVDMGRVAPKAWGLMQRSSFLAAALWFALADFFVGVTMLPWSSVIANCGVMLSIYLLVLGIDRDERSDIDRGRRTVIASGVVASVLPFLRLTTGAVYLTLVILLLVLLGRSGAAYRYQQLGRWFCRGAVAGLGGQVIALALVGSLAEWFRQSVLWPLRWKENIIDPLPFISASVDKSRFEIFLVVLFGLMLLILCRAKFPVGTIPRIDYLVYFAAFIIGSLLAAGIYASESDKTDLLLVTQFKYLARGRENLSLLFVLSTAGLLVGIGCLALIWTQRSDQALVNERFGGALIGVGAIATMSQVWPIPDSRHLWWGASVPILALVAWYSGNRRSVNAFFVMMSVPLVLASLVAFSITRNNLALPREAGPTGTALEGMMFGQSQGGTVDLGVYEESIRGLRTIVGDGDALFLSNNGFWAGYDNLYHSSDFGFVYWGPLRPLPERLLETSIVVIDLEVEPAYILSMQNNGFTRLAEYGMLVFYGRA
jgi:hypothetical protein